MSKSKEQCLSIISERFAQRDKVLALEESIKEISGSEYSLIGTYNQKTNILKTRNMRIPLSSSILESVLLSRKVFFDNHVQSHKKYDKELDNPLNINLKSIMIVPILNRSKENLIGFISAFNSMENGHEFQRYDTRSISLLNKYSREVIEFLLKNNFNTNEDKEVLAESPKIEVTKKIKKVNKIVIRKTKSDLENELSEQGKKLLELEQLLKVKNEEIDKIKKKGKEVVLVEKNIDELKKIVSFLSNEMTYLANDNHAIYTFLEVIRNSLYNKKQLAFIDEKLKNSQFINNFSDSVYTEAKIPLINQEFNPFESFASLTNLYSKAFVNENILFNVFIDPQLPSKMFADVEKIKSVIVHLINNVKGLIDKNGIATLAITYVKAQESIEIMVKGIQPKEERKFSDFFKSNVISNSLTSNNLGLGLSISSNLINILGAKLKLTTEGQNEHAFIALVPIKIVDSVEKKKYFKNKKPLKIGILFNEEDNYAYANLRDYLDAFSIDKSNIVAFTSYNKMNNLKISHFICFENMFSDKINMNKFPSITILTYSDAIISSRYMKSLKINELYINSYYGMALQKILFPEVKAENLKGNTLLVEDTFFTKITNKLKR
ncbi:MAG: Sensory transduction protein kinase [uncultured Sulfurovum sp.]|uniref:Sensory transduction protein kinase n=1 Tax=uncultured Sulfurovum sp. TaxID=269237 RepID=A0A6S6SK40_9BACT|nr:MAG: Sensory transduction protein kinase [uncultured Sulfurovum sp.]